MRKTIVKFLVGIGCLAIAAMGGYGGHSYHKLAKDRDQLQADIEKQKVRETALRQKSAEDQSRISGLMRAKQLAESQYRNQVAEHDSLRKQMDETTAALEQQKDAQMQQLEGQLAVANKQKAELTEAYTALKEQHRTALETVKERDAALAALEKTKQGLSADLQGEKDRLALCRQHNTQLAAITKELVEKYKNKGVTTSVLQAEPFTGIKKVEIENLVTEYQERIEKEQLPSK